MGKNSDLTCQDSNPGNFAPHAHTFCPAEPSALSLGDLSDAKEKIVVHALKSRGLVLLSSSFRRTCSCQLSKSMLRISVRRMKWRRTGIEVCFRRLLKSQSKGTQTQRLEAECQDEAGRWGLGLIRRSRTTLSSKVRLFSGSVPRAEQLRYRYQGLCSVSLRLPEWMLQRSKALGKLLNSLCNFHIDKLEDIETHHP